MELICPKCDARYNVPENALGPSGREVACTSCNNRWHAGGPQAPRPEAWGGQMAEIRQMLDEVQDPSKAPPPEPDVTRLAPAPAPEPVVEPEPNPAPAPAPTDLETREYVDPLRAKLAQQGSSRKGRRDDRRALMREHGRKVRRRKSREAAGSGAFLTGFLLLVLIAAIMTVLYTMKEPIKEKFPWSVAAMDQYAATIDNLHASVSEGYTALTEYVGKKLNG